MNDCQSFIHSKKNLNVMKQLAKAKKETQPNSFKQLERAYEKAFFKSETNRKGKFTLLDQLEDQFWAAVESKNMDVKLPNSDFKRKPVLFSVEEPIDKIVFS
jgi:beta-lactamase class D